jgi:hypothetical protein
MPGGDVEEFFCGLWLVTAEVVYQGSWLISIVALLSAVETPPLSWIL